MNRRAQKIASGVALLGFMYFLAGDSLPLRGENPQRTTEESALARGESEAGEAAAPPIRAFEKEAAAAPLKKHRKFPWLLPVLGAGAVVAALLLCKKKSTPEFTPRVPGIEMVPIPGGTFQMGMTEETVLKMFPERTWWYPGEEPVHTVTVSSFRMGKYEVTQGQWRDVMGEAPADYWRGENYPADRLKWEQCQEFIRKLNQMTGRHFRLPTEAEWEYACLGGGSKDPYGRPGNIAWFRSNSGWAVHPVGGKLPNGFGLYDMLGNVYEFCQDWYGPYSAEPQVNPTGPASGKYRVARGGSAISPIINMRAANRHVGAIDPTANGFRLAEDVAGN